MNIKPISIGALILFLFSVFFYKNYQDSKQNIVPDKNLLHDITLVTTSFDNNSEIWVPHYEFLFRNWPSLKEDNSFIPIILITNTLVYKDPRVTSVKIGPDITWSLSLQKALESVKTKYTLILMDDYIINAPVDQDRLVELITLLEKTDGAYIEIWQDDGMFKAGFERKKKYVKGVQGVIYRSKNSICRNALQASIWNTEELRKLIDVTESAWMFEITGNERTKNNPKPFYMVTANPVMRYLNATAKQVYEKDVVDYINANGVKFSPNKPIKDKSEMWAYLNTEEVVKKMKVDEASTKIESKLESIFNQIKQRIKWILSFLGIN